MSDQKTFVASPEAKSKARTNRIIAFVCWIAAMAGQVYAIFNLISNEKLMWLIGAIVVILILAMTGSWLWKKANRLDPASKKDATKFFIQNQLGAIMGVLAFLPLVVMILLNKDLDGKSKGIAGAIAAIAMVVAGVQGYEFEDISIEKYTEEINEQTSVLNDLTGSDNVYWTDQGLKYHIYDNCHHIKNRSTTNGTVKQSFETRGISELCITCQKKAAKNKPVLEEVLQE